MNKFLLYLFLLYPTCSLGSESEDVMTFLSENKGAEIISDFMKNTFSPPYEDTKPLFQLVEKCSYYFQSNPTLDTYLKVMAKNEFLGFAAGFSADSSDQNSQIGMLVQNSGGVIALHDYVSSDFAYLMSASEHTRRIANEFFQQHSDSPQNKKLSKYLLQLKDENISLDKKKDISFFYFCSMSDIYYTILGGINYSRTHETLSLISQQLQLKVRNELIKDIDEK
ncbi:hypothetical protein BOO92_20585 [Vibrio navarrensis]|uniref:hypothetical protein n=1 Tax=Vibrio navarrensis TaxID=29495 RepID=UPI0018691BB8|nr:hypothetical protein [Vibrio navarrensis]MBE3659063.1 hypothetical protein [Vibrio navarrensis]